MEPRVKIESLGVYLPETRLSTSELLEGCAVKPAFDLEGLTGIRSRPVVSEGEYALDLAKKAIAKCFEVSRYQPRDIDMLVCANISRVAGPNWKVPYEPSSSFELISSLDFGSTINFDVTSACAGMFMGILLVDSYIKAGWIERGMVVSGEYITHATRTAQKRIKNPIDPLFLSFTLGDSGAAVILEKTDDPSIGFHEMEFYTAAQHCNLCTGGWVEGDYGGFVGIADSRKMMDTGQFLGADMLARRVKGTPWERSDYQFGIFHQPAARPIKKMAKIANQLTGRETFSNDNLVMDVEERGNTNSTSVMVALWDSINNRMINTGDRVLFCCLGSGLTLGVAKYVLDDLPDRIRAAANS